MGMEDETYKMVKLNAMYDQKHVLLIGGTLENSSEVSVENKTITTPVPEIWEGFVGCLQGLMLGNRLVDIQRMATEMSQHGNMTQVSPGCAMKCDLRPCQNGGICRELWGQEGAGISCNCESTSYRGDVCELDIGAHYSRESSVFYFLDEDRVYDFDSIDITFAFSTEYVEGATLFMILYANSSRYLHVALMPDGQLVVEEDNGHTVCKLF